MRERYNPKKRDPRKRAAADDDLYRLMDGSGYSHVDKCALSLAVCIVNSSLLSPNPVIPSYPENRSVSVNGIGLYRREKGGWESVRWRRRISTCCSGSLEDDTETAPQEQDLSSFSGDGIKVSRESFGEKGEKAGTLAAAARRDDTSGSDG